MSGFRIHSVSALVLLQFFSLLLALPLATKPAQASDLVELRREKMFPQLRTGRFGSAQEFEFVFLGAKNAPELPPSHLAVEWNLNSDKKSLLLKITDRVTGHCGILTWIAQERSPNGSETILTFTNYDERTCQMSVPWMWKVSVREINSSSLRSAHLELVASPVLR